VHPKSGSIRATGPAFFGVSGAQESLKIKSAEARLDAGGGGQIKIAGLVTVFEAFSVFTQPVQFQLLGNNVSLKPDRKGHARTPNAEFQIKNASEYGVIYGGQMDFDLTLQGKEWREGLAKLGLTNAKAQRVNVPLRVEVGNAVHAATADVQCVSQ
jgi:hypothetical protein